MSQKHSPRSLILRLRTLSISKLLSSNALTPGWRKLNLWFLIAVIPSTLVGVWNIGFQIENSMIALGSSALSGWRHAWFLKLSLFEFGAISQFLLGLLYFLPLFLVSFATCRFWHWIFTKDFNQTRDRGNLLVSLLFVLLLPATIPIGFAILGVSFGIVFGKLIFGGNGRYLISPPLLGVLFLYYSYPGFFTGQGSFLPIAGKIIESTWRLLAEGGVQSSLDQGSSWTRLFMGNEIGAIGTTSTLAALIGLMVLVVKRVLSWRVITGALFGLILASLLLNSPDKAEVWKIPWYWHLVVGNFAFSLAFIATDPTVAPLSRGGCFIYGGLFGFLTLLIRTVNPDHPEATFLALMLASILVPLIDWLMVESHRCIIKRKRRLMS